MRPIALLIGGMLMLLLACVSPGGLGERIPPEQKRAYDVALSPLPKNPAEAEARLENFLEVFPDGPLSDDATEELARLALLQGRSSEAFDRLREVIQKYPKGNRVDSVRVRLARWEWEQGRPVVAMDLIEGVQSKNLNAKDRRAFARLRFRMTDDPVDQLLFLSDLRQQWAEEVSSQQDQEAASASLKEAESELNAVETEVDGLLASMTWDQLSLAAQALGREIPAGRIQLIMVWREMVGGQLDQARTRLSEVEDYSLTQGDTERLANLQQRLQGDSPVFVDLVPSFEEALRQTWPDLEDAQGTIGVVLPLSGRYAPFGQEVLQGILQASYVFKDSEEVLDQPGQTALGEPSPPRSTVQSIYPSAENPVVGSSGTSASLVSSDDSPGIRILVRDSEGNPDRAAEAVRELAEDDRLMAVIGPIFSAESDAAAREAERLEVPLLSLSNRLTISDEKKWVFRLRMTPEDEVSSLVDYAVDQMGLNRFAILYPTNRYGRGMRKIYWDSVLARGGQIVAVAGYEPNSMDFNDSIRTLVGYDLLTPSEQVALEERSKAMRRGRRLEPEQAGQLREILYSQLGPEQQPLPPLVDFEALFIPDAHGKIQLIAPQLAFHEVKGVQLLGSSQWNDPELVKIGRGHVRGALISSSFDINSRVEPVQDFVEGYRAEFGTDPDEFSSGGYDAMRLVLTQLVSGRESRQEVRDGLLLTYGYPGASGVTTIQPDGNARKRPFMLQVKNRRLQAVD